MTSPVRRCLAATLPVLVTLTVGQHGMAQPATSLSEALSSLADDIAARAVASDVGSLAILPFNMPDGSCTEFSLFVADELSVSFFTSPALTLALVDRQNISAILSDIGGDQPLNPETSQRIATTAGLDAFLVGSLTATEGSVRASARIVSADARMLSAAAIDLPIDGLVDELLSRPIPGNEFCNDPPFEDAASQAADIETGPVAVASRTFGDVTIEIQDIQVTDDGNAAVVRLMMLNEGSGSVNALGVQPRFFLSDGSGNRIGLDDHTGFRDCYGAGTWNSSRNDPGNCVNNAGDWGASPSLAPGIPHVATMRGRVGGNGEDSESPLVDDPLFLTGSMLLGERNDAVIATINFSNLDYTGE